MTELFKYQEISFESSDNIPKLTAISCNALVAIVSTSNNIVRVLQRNAVDEVFRVSEKTFDSHDSDISAISVQEAGTFAVSADINGNIHLWRTDSPNNSISYKYEYGSVTCISVSTKYILATFQHKVTGKGKMILIDKGLNMDDNWTVVRELEEECSPCTIAEHGNIANPQIVYYRSPFIVHEQNPLSPMAKTNKLSVEAKPWCMRRNTATRHLLVYEILIDRNVFLWAPMKSSIQENPTVYRMESKDELKINKQVSMSAVASSKIVILSSFDEKLYVIDMRRSDDIRNEKQQSENKQSEEKSPTTSDKSVLERMVREIRPIEAPIGNTQNEPNNVKDLNENGRKIEITEENGDYSAPETEFHETRNTEVPDGDSGDELHESHEVSVCDEGSSLIEELASIALVDSKKLDDEDSTDISCTDSVTDLEEQITRNAFWGLFVEK